MIDKHFSAIFVSTLICLSTLTPFVVLFILQSNFESPKPFYLDKERNENSTPRTFVLPANPAVAREQSRKITLLENSEMIKSCIISLVDKGHKFANVENVTADAVMFETLEFQINNNLLPSGAFDNLTRQKLAC